ncbi:hypothetical protein, partial [Aquiflexum sp.]|uniref:hypothetical protein n=1 Tax=Aquiflexum sp. TaxID=1872584 RepID=UPI00359307BA
MAGIYNNQFETPFSDVLMSPTTKIESEYESTNSFEFHVSEDSPFSKTYEAGDAYNNVTVSDEEFVGLLAELNDSEFSETLFELAHEFERDLDREIQHEFTDLNPSILRNKFHNYIDPLVNETHQMIDKVSAHFSGNNFSNYSENEIEYFFDHLEFEHSKFTPAQEQFLG